MRAKIIVAVLCCSAYWLPATLSLINSPAVRRVGARHAEGQHNRRASPAQDDRCPYFSRIERLETRQRPPGGTRRTGGAVRSNDLPVGFLSSTASDIAFDDEKPLSFEDFEKALQLNAPGEDGAGGESAAKTGINWQLLFGDVLAQPIFFGVFYLLATPAIRETVKSSFRVTLLGTCLGMLGSLPLFAYGLALETRRDWVWVRTAQAKTDRVVRKLFGSRRQVTKVTAVSIPLAALVGVSEECGFRGFLPLLLAAKTGLPVAAVVVVSGVFCGLLHAVSVPYFINAALNGMFFHGLLLSTGNIFVPVVAHAVHNAVALVHCHLKTSRSRP